ncbi:MAG: hypothetical protein QM820_35805 [Minicystis sp.]
MKARLQRVLATIERLGSGPAGLRRLAVLVVVLLGSVVFQGLQVDDLWHRAFFLHDTTWAHGKRPFWAIFTFFDGDPAVMARFRDLGMVPWWVDDHVRIAFMRPLSSFTHLVDYTLWPSLPGAMHLHSLAWYVALVVVAALLFRRILPPSVSALAGLLYAVDHTHGGVVGWVANRNAIISATFGFAALLFHDRASRGEARARWMAAGCLALALLGGESGLGAAAYLTAHALTLDRRAWRDRARDLVPHAAVLAAWMAAYRVGGYGAVGSGLYLDPGRSPLRVLAKVPEFGTLLLASEWGSIGAETELVLPPAGRTALLVVAAIIVVTSFVALARRLRDRPSTRFFLLGSLLAILPCCATMPATRLLLIPGFGLLGVVAEALADFAAHGTQARGVERVARGFFAGWVGGGHLVLSTLLLGPLAWQVVLLQETLARFSRSFPPDDAVLPSQRLVAVGVPDPTFAGYIPLLRYTYGWTVPRNALGLTNGTRPSEIRRIDASAVEVTAPGGFYQWATDLLERDPEVPVPVGTRIRLSDVTIDVVHTTSKGVPDVARFTFDAPADDARYRWVTWADGKYVPFQLPPVGAIVSVAPRTPGT